MSVQLAIGAQVSLWSLVKNVVGKDLSRVCLPVSFNEPLSSLQRAGEDLEYSSLLDRAARCAHDPLLQIALVASFAVSGYSSSTNRTLKPFNPLQGETYEADRPDQGIRFISEKLNPTGALNVEFQDGEHMYWSKVTTHINNVIMGSISIEHTGVLKIDSTKSLYSVKLKFRGSRVFERTSNTVVGSITDPSGAKVASLQGLWDTEMTLYRTSGTNGSEHGEVLWTKSPMPAHPQPFNFTPYAITLNEIRPGEAANIAATDSRFRPDQRALENGQYCLADKEKLRLEAKQRAARKQQKSGEMYKPVWFDKSIGKDGNQFWKYKGGYWEAKERGVYEGCEDIFGP